MARVSNDEFCPEPEAWMVHRDAQETLDINRRTFDIADRLAFCKRTEGRPGDRYVPPPFPAWLQDLPPLSAIDEEKKRLWVAARDKEALDDLAAACLERRKQYEERERRGLPSWQGEDEGEDEDEGEGEGEGEDESSRKRARGERGERGERDDMDTA